MQISMEFMAGGTLHQALEIASFTEEQSAFIAREILKALQFLHYRELIHRDLKGSNIMLTLFGEVKLSKSEFVNVEVCS